MKVSDRIKITIQILIGLNIGKNQAAIGRLLGYSNPSYFSQIINGKVSIPSDFLERLISLSDSISSDWLLHNQGFITHEKETHPYQEDMVYIIELQKHRIQQLEQEIISLKKELQQN
jgi:transcriptional regulator with XRE-family HTH domain